MLESQPLVNVVIRSFNEEDWIRSCLECVLHQDYSNFEITVVDSGSTDATLEIVREYDAVRLVKIADYLPGKAINAGIDAQSESVEYVLLISAHCLPLGKTFIGDYVDLLEGNDTLAGAYGKQVPMPFTSPDDTRDLLNAFGPEFRIQSEDGFFHNANSMLRMTAVSQNPINSCVKHIEDRIWAEDVLASGWKIAYYPKAQVYHHHGLNQHGKNKSFRADGVSDILRGIMLVDETVSFEVVHARASCVPIVLLSDRMEKNYDSETRRCSKLINDMNHTQPIFLITDHHYNTDTESISELHILSREQVSISINDSFRSCARKILLEIEKILGRVVDGLSFLDLSYPKLTAEYVDLARVMVLEGHLAGVLPAWRDYGNYWMRTGAEYVALDVNFADKEHKSPIYRSALGQGGCLRASNIRQSGKELRIDELIVTNDIDLIRREVGD